MGVWPFVKTNTVLADILPINAGKMSCLLVVRRLQLVAPQTDRKSRLKKKLRAALRPSANEREGQSVTLFFSQL